MNKTGLAPLALLLICATVQADSVFLRGGERLVGEVVSETKSKVVFKSQNLGRLSIPREHIQRIEREAPAPAPAAPQNTAAHASPTISTNLSTTPPAAGAGFFPWTGLPPALDTHDWIQLKSGEWLKGRMKSLQNEKMEFDSEELDLHEFDWEDIRALRLPGLNNIWFGDRQTVVGSLLVSTNTAQIFGASTNNFSRSELVAVTPTGKKELNNWSAKLSAGLTFRAGNTKQVDYNAHVTIDRRTPSTHLSFDYLGNLGRIDNQETVNNHRAATEFDYFLSRRLFLLLPFAEYYKDPLQNLDHRLTLGAGVGYDLINNRHVEWNVTAGPAYQRNWYTSVEAGENNPPGAAALVLSSQLEIEVTKRLDFIAEVRSQITRKQVGETTHHALATLAFEIHKRLDLDISFIWDRVSNPKPDATGVTPVKDDFRMILGLGLDF